MCECDPGYSGDGFNCAGMQLNFYLAGIYYTVYLQSCWEE